MSDQNDNYVAVLLEEIRDQNKTLLEGQAAMIPTLNSKANQDDLEAIKQDVKIIKAAGTATSQDLHRLELRFDHIEAHA